MTEGGGRRDCGGGSLCGGVGASGERPTALIGRMPPGAAAAAAVRATATRSFLAGLVARGPARAAVTGCDDLRKYGAVIRSGNHNHQQ